MSMEAGVGVMGTKLGMMSYFEPDEKVVPVTVVGFREGNIVTQIKTDSTDGYDAVQVGYRRVRDKKLTKPELGHLEKAGVIPMRHLQEFRLQDISGFEVGKNLVLEEIFKEGDLVDVSGTTIGKGFQGGIKRHNFKRGLMTHGSKSHRALGSIGAGTIPGRVYKGKKMPGRMGGTKTKIRKLKIVKIDNDLRVVMVKGAVPVVFQHHKGENFIIRHHEVSIQKARKFSNEAEPNVLKNFQLIQKIQAHGYKKKKRPSSSSEKTVMNKLQNATQQRQK